MEDITGLDPNILKNGDKTQIPNPEANGYEPKDICSLYYESNTLNSEGKPTDLGTWRTPNQKEMALMLSKKVELNILDKTGTGWNQTVYNYLTRTQYSGTWHGSPGFGCEGGSINLTPHTSGNDRIRCVRDVDPTVIVNNQ